MTGRDGESRRHTGKGAGTGDRAEMKMNEIVLIRHGESEANLLRIVGGDYPLSEVGRQHAMEERKYYGDFGVDEVYCSCLKRTGETAGILFSTAIPEERKLPEFNEVGFGVFEGVVASRDGKKRLKHSYAGDFVAFQHECSGENPYRRADQAIRKMGELSRRMAEHPEQYPNKRIAVVTSATLMGCIMLTLLRGHRWRKIISMPHPKNLERISFACDEETNRIVSFTFGGTDYPLA